MSMDIEEHAIVIERTARFAQLGKLSDDTETLWLVVHGYAQLARDFISVFKPLANSRTVIVAPEGLSRFYAKGFYGNVAACWMTREDRANEIKDYVNYIDKLQKQLTGQYPGIKINLLGFSQGVATISRYVAIAKPRFNQLWLCAGELPADIDWDAFKQIMGDKEINFMVGDNDPFVTEKGIKQIEDKLSVHDLAYQTYQFKGVHEVSVDLLAG